MATKTVSCQHKFLDYEAKDDVWRCCFCREIHLDPLRILQENSVRDATTAADFVACGADLARSRCSGSSRLGLGRCCSCYH